MDLRDLVQSLLARDALSARQWVDDAKRGGLRWTTVSKPVGLDETALAVAAGVAELLAERAGQEPPLWVRSIGPAPEPVYLVSAALRMPRLRRSCLEDGPEPLRRRRILAPPDFLTAA